MVLGYPLKFSATQGHAREAEIGHAAALESPQLPNVTHHILRFIVTSLGWDIGVCKSHID